MNLLLASYGVYSGKLSAGGFILANALYSRLDSPLHNLGNLFRQMNLSTVDIEDLYKIMQTESLVTDKPDAADFQFKKGKIVLKNVSFAYKDEERKVLKGVDLEIQPGKFNCIIGKSGEGKSTLLSLITRTYDPVSGSVEIDGQNLKDVKANSFKKHVAVIPQNGILFDDTILYNLQYGNPDASMEEIIEVAKKCKIHHKISEMEGGYNCRVGELGDKLSGGEKQRILIARSLLSKEKEIFLMDEFTSNLDPSTEAKIIEELKEMLEGKTVVYCAHRERVVKKSDVVHVMKEGKVVESGDYYELESRPWKEFHSVMKPEPSQ
jgi:ABC-type bacteriocin/lantibiotic exporter with double-glycine peptidase domain